mgnify:CR=1 FL=1
MIFFSPDLPVSNPYDQLYALNKADQLDNKQNLVQNIPAKFDIPEDDDIDDDDDSNMQGNNDLVSPNKSQRAKLQVKFVADGNQKIVDFKNLGKKRHS